MKEEMGGDGRGFVWLVTILLLLLERIEGGLVYLYT